MIVIKDYPEVISYHRQWNS